MNEQLAPILNDANPNGCSDVACHVIERVVCKGVVYHLGLKQNQLARNILLVCDPARAHTVAVYCV
jgi:hypothetical protein